MRSSGMADIKIEYYDERLTTVMAEKVLIEADVRRGKRKKVIDKQAAVIILQGISGFIVERQALGEGPLEIMLDYRDIESDILLG